MVEHDGCIGCKYEYESEESIYCVGCVQNAVDKYEPQSNADRIRGMNDQTLALFLESVGEDEGIYDFFCSDKNRTRVCDSFCKKCIVDWLRQPAETEGAE